MTLLLFTDVVVARAYSLDVLLVRGDSEGGDPPAGEAMGDPVEATTLLKSSRSTGAAVADVAGVACRLDEDKVDEEEQEEEEEEEEEEE